MSEPALGPDVLAKDGPYECVLGGGEPALGPDVLAKDGPHAYVLGGGPQAVEARARGEYTLGQWQA